MMPAIDFDALKDQVGLSDLLVLFECHTVRECLLKSRSGCPLGCHDDPRCCSISHISRTWYCHRCATGGTALDVVMKRYGLDAYPAALKLCALLGRPVPYLPTERQKRERKPRERRKKAEPDADDEGN